MTVDVLRTRFILELGGPAAAAQVEHLWRRCLGETGPTTTLRVRRLVVADTDLLLSRPLLHRLAYTMTRDALEDLSGLGITLHAAGLARRDGHVTALVAASGTGKTTAAVKLSRSTFGYVTDETVAVGPDLRILAFPKPVAVIDDPSRPADKVHLSPDDLGLLACPADLWLGRIVLLDRDPDHPGSPTLTRIPTDQALMEIIPHTSALTRLDQPLVTLTDILRRTGGAWRLTYSEIDTAGHLLLTSDGEAESAHDHRSTRLTATVAVQGEGVTCLRAAPIVDGVDFGDSAVLLVGNTPILLNELARTVWLRAGGGASESDLLRAAIGEHGDAPGAGKAVSSVIEQLIRAGALLRT